MGSAAEHVSCQDRGKSNHSGRRLEEPFVNAQRRKVKQMQRVWVCLISDRQFEDTFDETPWTEFVKSYSLLVKLFSTLYIFDKQHKYLCWLGSTSRNWREELQEFLAVPRQLYWFPCHWVTDWVTDCHFWKTLPKSTLRDLWPLRHVFYYRCEVLNFCSSFTDPISLLFQ